MRRGGDAVGVGGGVYVERVAEREGVREDAVCSFPAERGESASNAGWYPSYTLSCPAVSLSATPNV